MTDLEPQPRRPDTSDPRRSRQRALKVLFEADLRGEDPRITLDRVLVDPEATALLDEVDLDDLDLDDEDRAAAGALLARPGSSRLLDGYAQRLVTGVADHLEEIDHLIREHARGWRLERMPLVDRNVLRMSIHEMQWEGVKAAIVIDQAVDIVRELSSDEAPRFVNGVLEAVRRQQLDNLA